MCGGKAYVLTHPTANDDGVGYENVQPEMCLFPDALAEAERLKRFAATSSP